MRSSEGDSNQKFIFQVGHYAINASFTCYNAIIGLYQISNMHTKLHVKTKLGLNLHPQMLDMSAFRYDQGSSK